MSLPELDSDDDQDLLDDYVQAQVHGLRGESATGRQDPQSLKRVWHLVARFGRPLVEPTTEVR